MFFGIGNLGFFWTKILPISYQNYLSETEILEAMRKKLDTTIYEVNRIEMYLQENLDEQITETVKKSLAETTNKIVDLNTRLDELETFTCKHLSLLNSNLQELTKQHIKDISDLHNDINNIIIDISKICTDNLEIMVELLKAVSATDKNYTDSKVSNIIRLLSMQWDRTVRYVEDRLKKLIVDTIVINPITGTKTPLQKALFDIVDFFNENSLTALQYRMLNLTALDYRLLDLTALEYRLWFSHHVDFPKPKQIDLFGRKRENPVSSVYAGFGDGVRADMSTLPITAELYKRYSNKYNSYMLDKWGYAILSNHYPSFFNNVVYLYSDTVVTANAKDTVKTILKLKDDFEDITGEDILTEKSLENIVIQNDVEIVNHASGCYNVRCMAVGLVAGGIACDLEINNECRQGNGDICSLMIDLRAVTCIS